MVFLKTQDTPPPFEEAISKELIGRGETSFFARWNPSPEARQEGPLVSICDRVPDKGVDGATAGATGPHQARLHLGHRLPTEAHGVRIRRFGDQSSIC